MEQAQLKPNFSHIIKNNPSGYILRTNHSEKTDGLLQEGLWLNWIPLE